MLIRRFTGAIGIHPHNARDYNDAAAERLGAALNHTGIVALGEIGLDFFKNYSPRPAQVKAFEGQMELAVRLGLPVIIHSRDSRQETIELVKKFSGSLTAGE